MYLKERKTTSVPKRKVKSCMQQNRDEIIALVKIGGDAAQSLSGSRILAE